MPAAARPPIVAVCAGSDCARDERTRFRKLIRTLADVDVVRTPCLGVCHGPVAVLAPTSDSPVVVERIRKRHHDELHRHVSERSLPSRSSALRVVTSAKRRRKAVKRLRQVVAAQTGRASANR